MKRMTSRADPSWAELSAVCCQQQNLEQPPGVTVLKGHARNLSAVCACGSEAGINQRSAQLEALLLELELQSWIMFAKSSLI